ncbi:MAG: c-type cytochrome domain-containing protein [Pirellulaceae bacterium]
MMRLLKTIGLGICITIVVVIPAPASETNRELAEQGYAAMRKYCFDCHGATFNGSSAFDLNNVAALTVAHEGETPYINLDSPEESLMWQRIADDEMPPEDSPQPSPEERQLIRRWIAAGAPAPPPRQVVTKTEAELVAEILADIETFDEDDAIFQRYFTLHHIAARLSVTEYDLRLYRAALSKVINSLSMQNDIVLPEAIDQQQTVFRIDLRDLGWDTRQLWRSVLKQYPYGLTYDRVTDDPQLQRRSVRLARASGTKVSYLRADWFVVHATRGSLYDAFLGLPATAKQLEHRLGLDTQAAFVADPPRLVRAGFDESGVSIGARVLSRYGLPSGGYYWVSDDFVKANRRSSLYRFALGPIFEGNEFADRFGYQHDGGEIIFSLPNGLQGYMLVDGKGNRIAKGPIEVVRDSKEIGGTPEVVNAISCMHCHQHGMVRFEDSVRESLGIRGRALEKAKQIYVPTDQMRKLVQADSSRFLAALSQATGPFLQVGNEADKDIKAFTEPIGVVAKNYSRDLSLGDVAQELGLDATALKQSIQQSDALQFLGLGPLAIDRKINRAAWDSQQFKFSLFQLAAQELGLGSMFLEY